MADLDTMLAGMGGAGGDTAGNKPPPEPKVRDKNKPVPWVPRKKGGNTLEDAKHAVETEDWAKAFQIMMEVNKDKKLAADPVAKQLNNLLMQKMGGVAPAGAQ
jgi:hypothetical protein